MANGLTTFGPKAYMQPHEKMLLCHAFMILLVGFVGLKWLMDAKKKHCDYHQTDEHPLFKMLEDL